MASGGPNIWPLGTRATQISTFFVEERSVGLFCKAKGRDGLQGVQTVLTKVPVRLIAPTSLNVQLPTIRRGNTAPLRGTTLGTRACRTISNLPDFSLSSKLCLRKMPTRLRPKPCIHQMGNGRLSSRRFVTCCRRLTRRCNNELGTQFVGKLYIILGSQRQGRTTKPRISAS